jgi:hypothetical protein
MSHDMTLATFAFRFAASSLTVVPQDIAAQLVTHEAKKAFARTQLERVCDLFNIEEVLDELADMFADPAHRGEATDRMFACGYKPGVTFAGVCIASVMDDVYADTGHGACHTVGIPEAWPTELWSSDRDYTDEGLVYSHWVTATLPTAHLYADNLGGYKAVLLSDRLYGTLWWGGHRLTLTGGHVAVHKLRYADMLDEYADMEQSYW